MSSKPLSFKAPLVMMISSMMVSMIMMMMMMMMMVLTMVMVMMMVMMSMTMMMSLMMMIMMMMMMMMICFKLKFLPLNAGTSLDHDSTLPIFIYCPTASSSINKGIPHVTRQMM